jgi:hypothetical protein
MGYGLVCLMGERVNGMAWNEMEWSVNWNAIKYLEWNI